MLNLFEKLLPSFPDETPKPFPPTLWAFLWQAAHGCRHLILAMSLLTALIGGIDALFFAGLGWVVDAVTHTPSTLFWHKHGFGLITVAVLMCATTLLVAAQTMYQHQALAGNFPMRLRWRFHRLMLQQSMRFYQDEFAGRIASKVMQTALAVRDVWFISTDILVYVLIFLATMLVVVGEFHPLLMLPFMLWIVFYALMLAFFMPRLSQASRHQADARALMTGRIADAYANISTVKLFSHTPREAQYARGAMQDFLGTVHGQMRYVTGVEICNHILNISLVLMIVGVALWLVGQGKMSAGGVAAATAIALRLSGMSHWVMWELTSLYENLGTVIDGMSTLSTVQDIQDIPQAIPLAMKHGEIEFRNINFAYTMARPVFDSFSLTIAAGEKVGLIGRSGAGKSTLVNLLLRLFELDAGAIFIDGQDIRSVTQQSLRQAIGMVTQDISLLHRSVRDNLTCGRPQATEAEIITATRKAEAHDFIMGLADAEGRRGYDVHVGERGIKLSGGQRQRIAIARVMLKDAPILVLDEATSALDSEMEAMIQRSLYALMEGKTVLAIAHRLSTIATMDRLVVIDNGRIIEQGSHAELLKNNQLYASLWHRQSGGFLGE